MGLLSFSGWLSLSTCPQMSSWQPFILHEVMRNNLSPMSSAKDSRLVRNDGPQRKLIRTSGPDYRLRGAKRKITSESPWLFPFLKGHKIGHYVISAVHGHISQRRDCQIDPFPHNQWPFLPGLLQQRSWGDRGLQVQSNISLKQKAVNNFHLQLHLSLSVTVCLKIH